MEDIEKMFADKQCWTKNSDESSLNRLARPPVRAEVMMAEFFGLLKMFAFLHQWLHNSETASVDQPCSLDLSNSDPMEVILMLSLTICQLAKDVTQRVETLGRLWPKEKEGLRRSLDETESRIVHMTKAEHQESKPPLDVTTPSEGKVLTPEKQTTTTEGKVLTPEKQATATKEKLLTPKRQATTSEGPERKVLTLKKQATATEEKVSIPKKQATATKEEMLTPKRQAIATEEKVLTPKKQATAPEWNSLTPEKQATENVAQDDALVRALTTLGRAQRKVKRREARIWELEWQLRKYEENAQWQKRELKNLRKNVAHKNKYQEAVRKLWSKIDEAGEQTKHLEEERGELQRQLLTATVPLREAAYLDCLKTSMRVPQGLATFINKPGSSFVERVIGQVKAPWSQSLASSNGQRKLIVNKPIIKLIEFGRFSDDFRKPHTK